MGEVKHRDLPKVRAEVFEGDSLQDCIVNSAMWVADHPEKEIIGYIHTYVDWSPSVTVVYEELRRLDNEVSTTATISNRG